MEPDYGSDRIRRLRIVVGVLAVLALISCGVGIYVLASIVPDEPDRTPYAVVLTIASALLLAGAVVTWVKLPLGSRGVIRGSVACGVGALPLAFLTSGMPLGLLFALVGLALLFLALASERPEQSEQSGGRA